MNELTFLTQEIYISQIVETLLVVLRVKEKFLHNPGHNVLTLFDKLAQVQIATSKTIRDIRYKELGKEVAPRVAKRHRT